MLDEPLNRLDEAGSAHETSPPLSCVGASREASRRDVPDHLRGLTRPSFNAVGPALVTWKQATSYWLTLWPLPLA
ncbi:MAG: hypothetical protein M3P44_04175 [Actinomycetota bacterium]|nr:hypothetical protein [Actinomycetota bacterium]